MASKVLDSEDAKIPKLSKLTRDQVECELEFLGLIIMENRLKEASVGVIKELKNACIRPENFQGGFNHQELGSIRLASFLSN